MPIDFGMIHLLFHTMTMMIDSPIWKLFKKTAQLDIHGYTTAVYIYANRHTNTHIQEYRITHPRIHTYQKAQTKLNFKLRNWILMFANGLNLIIKFPWKYKNGFLSGICIDWENKLNSNQPSLDRSNGPKNYEETMANRYIPSLIFLILLRELKIL